MPVLLTFLVVGEGTFAFRKFEGEKGDTEVPVFFRLLAILMETARKSDAR